MTQKKISLVVPVYYEEECVAQFLAETLPILEALEFDFEYVFVDDGSTDKTISILKNRAVSDKRIKLVELSYNHGKQAAVTAGIHYSTGDYLLYMDPDLQDPPNEISKFVEEIEKGFDIVFGRRNEKKDTFLNQCFSKAFWWFLDECTGLKLPKGLAVMRIFNRKFANRFLEYREQNRFLEGMFMHIGLKRSVITIAQRDRFAGQSKFNFRRKIQLAFDAILDYSEIPLRLAVRLGFLLTLFGMSLLAVVLFLKLTILEFQMGWPSVIGTIIICTGIQLTFLGVTALYIGRTYREVKGRPLFSVRETTNL